MENNIGTKKGVISKPIRYGLAIIGSTFCVCCAIFASINSNGETTQLPTEINPPTEALPEVSPEVSQQNSPTPTIVPTEQILPEPTSQLPALIPGLYPADVTINMEEMRGFTCGEFEQGDLYYTRECRRAEVSLGITMIVTIYGRELLSVDLIEAVIFQDKTPDLDIPTSFLGFVATMPYDGSVPSEARTWVETTLEDMSNKGFNQEATAEFGGVKYHLYGPATALTLEMGDLK